MYPYCFVPLIRKNTPIPVSRSEGFCTIFDGQSKVDINVYQGEDPDALNNIEIGRFTIEGLRDAPAGNPLITTFSLDVNGILQVTSREKETGLVHSITIDNAISRFTGDKLAEARERIDGCLASRKAPERQPRLPPRRACRRQQAPARRSRRPDRKGRAPAGQGGYGRCRGSGEWHRGCQGPKQWIGRRPESGDGCACRPPVLPRCLNR
jgi:hypothetical protein